MSLEKKLEVLVQQRERFSDSCRDQLKSNALSHMTRNTVELAVKVNDELLKQLKAILAQEKQE